MQFKKYKLILLLFDLLLISVSTIAAYWLKNLQLEAEHFTYFRQEPLILIPYILLLISIIVIFRNSGLYRMNILFDSYYQVVIILKAILVGYGILITTLFFLKHPLLEYRSIIIPSFLFLFVLLIGCRIIILKYTLRFTLKRKIIGEKVILVGAGNKGRTIAKDLLNNNYAYFTPIGFLDDDIEAGQVYEGIRVLDKIDNISKYSDEFDEILIALENVTFNDLQIIIDNFRRLKRPIHIISDLYRIISEKVEVENLDGLRTFQVPPTSGFKEYPYIIFKRITDYVVALSVIILLLPFWIVIIVLIKTESSGPVLFKAERIGYKRKPFVFYKFRSMYHGCDVKVHEKLVKDIAMGVQKDGKKLVNDKRVTKIGSWMRRYSIDELPQLVNVLKGEMTLVGPRPILPYEYELLDEWQKERFEVMPGVTGLWQVRGRNEVNFKDQHVLDLYYVRNRSILLDIQILFNTISIVISGETGI